MNTNNNAEFLTNIILMDSDGNPAEIISVRGSESGLDHLEIITQSAEELEMGIATRHRLTSEEIEEQDIPGWEPVDEIDEDEPDASE